MPLTGVRVIDFGQYLAGPAVAMILGDLGATVVRIEHPDGPLWDNPANAVLNRNKMVVTLDLKSEADLAAARSLIADADVVVENFRPGVMSRLGLDLAELRVERPELVTVSLPGFASDDELRRDWKAFESIIAAASGVFTDMGLNRVLMGVNPSFSPLPLSSAYATTIAASAVAIALYSRMRTGRGDHIEVPLASAVMEGLTYNSLKVDGYPDRYKTQREQEIERRRAAGEAMDLSYEDLQELLDPFYRSYTCSDGRMFYVVCPSHRNHAKRCLQALGLYEELVAEGLKQEDDVYLPKSEWTSDVSLGSYPLPKQWADKIATRMKEVFLTKTSAEWTKVFGEGQFPGVAHLWLEEWMHDRHVREAGLVVELDDPEYGRMIQPGPVAWTGSRQALVPAARRTVTFAEAKRELARHPHLPFPSPQPQAPRQWLAGVRVLDLCNVIAGPHSAVYLARFGAEVIKIDPAVPLYDPWNTVVFGMTHMRGKQSALVDLRSEAGRAILEQLLASVDVVVWNATDRQFAALGLDPEHLAEINPRLVVCQLDCFSGPTVGPRTDYLGYDDLVQAATGIMLRFGGSMATPEEHAHVGTIDVMCGFAAALGVGAALFQRELNGSGDDVHTSLSALSGLAQMPFFFDYEGRGPFDEPSGRDVTGYGPLESLYLTGDGRSVMLAATEDDVEAIVAIDGMSSIKNAEAADLSWALSSAFLTASADTWQDRFTQAGLGCVVCVDIDELRSEHAHLAGSIPPRRSASSFSFSRFPDHPSGHEVTQLDPIGVRTSEAVDVPPAPAEKYGTSTRSVLRSLGFADGAIDAMVAQGSVSESWSEEYLPS
jgi:crotonobetainyl-CoA:carnitine CoA-transferase CaiB-like acyl-CoA transferase